MFLVFAFTTCSPTGKQSDDNPNPINTGIASAESKAADKSNSASIGIKAPQTIVVPAKNDDTEEPALVDPEVSRLLANRNSFKAGNPPSITSLLKFIPYQGADFPGKDAAWIGLGIRDYSRLREVLEIDPLAGGHLSQKEIRNHVNDLTKCPNQSGKCSGNVSFTKTWISGFHPFATNFYDNRTYLSYDLRLVNADAFFWYKGAPVEVVLGTFSPSTTDKTIGNCKDCPIISRGHHEEQPYYRWETQGDADPSLSFAPPIFDNNGFAGNLAVFDEVIYRTSTTEAIKDVIKTHNDKNTSVGTQKGMASIGDIFDSLNVFSAFIPYLAIPESSDFNASNLTYKYRDHEQQRLALKSGFDDYPFLDDYKQIGYGIGEQDEVYYLVIVLVFDDAETAKENIEKAEDILDYHKFNYQQWVPIRERSKPGWDSDDWSDYFSSWEVWTEDHALAMKLKLLDNGKSMTKSILYTGYYPILYKP